VAYRLVEGGEQPADLDLSTSGLHQYRMDDRR